jgi:hypothetical protein
MNSLKKQKKAGKKQNESNKKRRSRKSKSRINDPFTDGSPVRHVIMPDNVRCVYDFPVRNAVIEIFLLSKELLRKIAIKGRKLIAVKRIENAVPGILILYLESDRFDIGRVIYDRFTDLYAIESGPYDLVFLSDVSVLGEPIGYCDIDDLERDRVRFRKSV